MMVESGGNLDAVGDGGRAIGPYQIHEVYWMDAAQYDPTLKYGGQTYQNCIGPGSMEYSERVMQAYMSRYATARRLGHAPTDEDIARIHNGGPNGYRNPNTLGYWQKVRHHLHRVVIASIRSYLGNPRYQK